MPPQAVSPALPPVPRVDTKVRPGCSRPPRARSLGLWPAASLAGSSWGRVRDGPAPRGPRPLPRFALAVGAKQLAVRSGKPGKSLLLGSKEGFARDGGPRPEPQGPRPPPRRGLHSVPRCSVFQLAGRGSGLGLPRPRGCDRRPGLFGESELLFPGGRVGVAAPGGLGAHVGERFPPVCGALRCLPTRPLPRPSL